MATRATTALDNGAVPINGRIVLERVCQLYDALRRENDALKKRCVCLEQQLAQRTQEEGQEE